MRSLFFFWLTFSLASVGHLSLADFDQLDILGLQTDDATTTSPLADSRTPTEFVADNPTRGLGFGAQDSGQIPEDSIEGNNNQQEGRSKADTSKCRRSAPRSSGAKRRREKLNYCPNELITGPSPSQQQQKVRPTGNMGNEGKPGDNPLLSPDQAKPEWAPPLSDFFMRDPCKSRPWRVCAPYMPGRDFEEWSSNSVTMTLDLMACEMYNPILPACTPPLPQVAGLWCCQSIMLGDTNNQLYPRAGHNCIQKGVSKLAF